MSVIVFRLNGVEFEEAEAVRQLLTSEDIAFYETSEGRFGVSLAAIWLHQDDDFDRARALIDEYQQQRSQCRPEPISLWQRFKLAPVQCVVLVLAVIALIYWSIMPFLVL